LVDVAQDRDKWRAVVNSVMNLQFPKNTVNFFSKWGTVTFQKRTLLQSIVFAVHRKAQQKNVNSHLP
jgi:hypothetical protein